MTAAMTANSGSSDRGADATRTVPALPKLTPWFSQTVKPARIGLYETRMPYCEPKFRVWDGRIWRFQSGAPCSLFGMAGDQWRGLTSDPSKINRR